MLAFVIVIAAFNGEVEKALWFALFALFIDGTDGMLARWLRVSETIPWFDGARLDDIVDYLTYAFAPIVLLWTGDYLPTTPPARSSPACRCSHRATSSAAPTPRPQDHFFLGFPSYWNVVAFYVIVLELSPTATGHHPGSLRGARLRADPLHLPVAHQGLPDPQPRLHGDLARVVRGPAVADARPAAGSSIALSLAYLAYYGGISLYLTMILPRLPGKVLSKEAIAAELED